MEQHGDQQQGGGRQKITLEDLLDLGPYERARDEIRKSAIAARALRRVNIGPNASLSFENRETVRYQIQEMIRSERMAKLESMQHEAETYSELLPGSRELSGTLMLEFVDPAERGVMLGALRGIEDHLHLEIGAERVTARFDLRQMGEEKVSAVHFVRFPMSEGQAAALHDARRGGSEVALVLDHAKYGHRAVLSAETLAGLVADLDEAAAHGGP